MAATLGHEIVQQIILENLEEDSVLLAPICEMIALCELPVDAYVGFGKV